MTTVRSSDSAWHLPRPNAPRGGSFRTVTSTKMPSVPKYDRFMRAISRRSNVGPCYVAEAFDLCLPDDLVCSSGTDFNAHIHHNYWRNSKNAPADGRDDL